MSRSEAPVFRRIRIAVALAVGAGLVIGPWWGLYVVAGERPGKRTRALEARVQALEERWLLDQFLREAPLPGREPR